MRNLAGNQDCDNIIREELRRCRIDAVDVPRDDKHSEVPYTVEGKLGAFTFRRAWSYWVVKGLMPLHLARELYADPIGAEGVRVNGNCTCPAPIGHQVEWILPNGRKALTMATKAECEGYVTIGGSLKPISEKILAEHEFSDDPESLGASGFIDLYHVDSEAGLRLFADTIRNHLLGENA